MASKESLRAAFREAFVDGVPPSGGTIRNPILTAEEFDEIWDILQANGGDSIQAWKDAAAVVRAKKAG